MGTPILVLVVALYSAVATSYLEARRHREPPPAWARSVGPIAVAAHLLGLILLSKAIGRSPFATPSQSLSFLAFSLAGLYLILEATSRVATHGGAFYVLAAVLAALGVPGLIDVGASGAIVRDTLKTFHVGLSLMGTAAILAGGLLAGGYLGQYRRVKRGTLRGSGATGPSLRGFERLDRRASFLGVLLLGPALAMGIVIIIKRSEPPPGAMILLALTSVVLVLVTLAAWIWWRRPLRGHLAAWLNLASLVVVLLALLVVHPIVSSGAPH